MYNEDSILTWGKYKFTAIRRIPASWLLSKHNNRGIQDKALVEWVGLNLESLKTRQEKEKKNGTPTLLIPAPPICNKYQYIDENQAKKHLREIANKGSFYNNHKIPVRTYECPICKFWHLTSKP